jgi:uncharacterized membrane protein
MKPTYYSLVITLVWSLWPILARLSGFPSGWVTFSVCIITGMLAVAWVMFTGQLQSFEATTLQKSYMIFAGLCNAVGIVLYGKILETKDSTKYIILLMVLIPIVTYAGSICVFKEKFEPEKLISLGVIIIGLYFFLR